MTTTTTTITVPTGCAALCLQVAALVEGLGDELAAAGDGASLDYGTWEQRIADTLGAVARRPRSAPGVGRRRRPVHPGLGRRVRPHRSLRQRLPHAHRHRPRHPHRLPQAALERVMAPQPRAARRADGGTTVQVYDQRRLPSAATGGARALAVTEIRRWRRNDEATVAVGSPRARVRAPERSRGI
jgi:hypothetical protein